MLRPAPHDLCSYLDSFLILFTCISTGESGEDGLDRRLVFRTLLLALLSARSVFLLTVDTPDSLSRLRGGREEGHVWGFPAKFDPATFGGPPPTGNSPRFRGHIIAVLCYFYGWSLEHVPDEAKKEPASELQQKVSQVLPSCLLFLFTAD